MSAASPVGMTYPGLHEAGSDMTRDTGSAYLGSGIAIGPALAFGYIAAHHAAAAAR